MPDPRTLARVRDDKRKGESASTQAGEFVREEIHHVREGKHGARSPQQAIAIGLSKARRAGVELPPPRKGRSSVRRRAKRDLATGRKKGRRPSRTRSRATESALEREGHHSASHEALARQGRRSAARRTHAQRSASARKAARTRARRRSS
ncbi:MAG TPA: DUF6496 domain-containing protein [Myxococcota bacterium]|nr:DUF6496 domain-containing protein [Myxococcota bacterium]